jgi:tetratricopeptide (TPR) repeat protein
MSKLSSIRVPAEIFDVRGIASYCPGCGPDVPGLGDLAAHLDVLGRLYASSDFLRFRSFAPAPVVVDLPSVLDADGSLARAEVVLRSGYLQRIVGIDPHGLPSPLKPARLAALAAFAEKHPDNPVALLRLGLAHLADGRFAEAAAAIRRAADLAPAFAPARLGHAQALLRLRRVDEAVAAFRAGIDLAPRDVPARVALLDVLALAGKQDELSAEVGQILGLDPGNGAAHRVQCVLDFERGDVAGARDHCQRALDGGASVNPRLMIALSLGR